MQTRHTPRTNMSDLHQSRPVLETQKRHQEQCRQPAHGSASSPRRKAMKIQAIPDNQDNIPTLVLQLLTFSIQQVGAPDTDHITPLQMQKSINILGIAYYYSLEAFRRDLASTGILPHEADQSKRQLDNGIKKESQAFIKDIDWEN